MPAYPVGRASPERCPSYRTLAVLSKITLPSSHGCLSAPGLLSSLRPAGPTDRPWVLLAQGQGSDPGVPHTGQALVVQGVPQHAVGAAQLRAALPALPAGRDPGRSTSGNGHQALYHLFRPSAAIQSSRGHWHSSGIIIASVQMGWMPVPESVDMTDQLALGHLREVGDGIARPASFGNCQDAFMIDDTRPKSSTSR